MMTPSVEDIDRFLSYIFHDGTGKSTPFLRRLTFTLLHPVVALGSLHYVLRSPIVNVTVPPSEKSRAWWMYDRQRPWRLQGFISSYIELPTPIEHFWRGQARQNLRKSTARARAAGFRVKTVSPSEIVEVTSQVFTDSGWKQFEIENAHRNLRAFMDGVICVGVFDDTSRAVAFCLGTQAGNIVRNVWAYTSLRGTVRWLCFSGYVEEVNARGAKFIIESPPWAFTGGNDVFAGNLGFKPARIRSNRVSLRPFTLAQEHALRRAS